MKTNPRKVKAEKKVRITTGNAILNRLYSSARDYVEAHKGSCVVVGGVAIVDEGKPHSYGVMVRFLGRKPVYQLPPSKPKRNKIR